MTISKYRRSAMLRRSLSPGSHRIQKLTDQQQKLMEADYKNASEMVMNYHKQRLTLFIAILPALGLFSRELLWSSTGGESTSEQTEKQVAAVVVFTILPFLQNTLLTQLTRGLVTWTLVGRLIEESWGYRGAFSYIPEYMVQRPESGASWAFRSAASVTSVISWLLALPAIRAVLTSHCRCYSVGAILWLLVAVYLTLYSMKMLMDALRIGAMTAAEMSVLRQLQLPATPPDTDKI